ncbi:hypothetical protein [Tumebacillus lipolyticus]|uniref:DUF304 domain-containing protein n=1 Tax=Tumebacillus lipolyticus TaxID=1280370 RepID=A0ABW5A0F0_9BACL
MIQDVQRRAASWQAKRDRMKRVVLGSATVVLAVLTSIVWNLLHQSEIAWLPTILVGALGLGTFLFTLSAYTNISLVTMYYTACAHLVEGSDQLELITGTIEEVHAVNVPAIGRLHQITLNVAGQKVRYYVPGKLLSGLHRHQRIRALTHELFAVRVETVDFDRAPGESTWTA